MRTWFWTVLLVSLAVLVALVIHRFPGNVLIVVDQWRVQVSLAFAILFVVASFAGIYLFIRMLTWLANMPERYRGWRGQRQEKREQGELEAGWTALLEGRYTHAEKTLTRLSGKSADKRRKVLATLSAARAAHEVGEFKRQDELIAQAQAAAAGQSGDIDLNTAVAAAAADLWLEQGRAEEALGALQIDHVQPMRHLHTMRLLLRVYQQTGNHAKVLELARALRRKDALSQDEANKLIETSASALIAQSEDKATWQACWKELKPEEKTLPDIALAAAQAFQTVGDYKEATRVLEAALTKGDKTDAPLNPKLLAAYARAEPEQVTPRLQKAEQWLQARKTAAQNKPQNQSPGTSKLAPEHADLLTTLGALCLAAQMWGQAQRYLEQSTKLRNDARVHALLGSLFDRIGQPQRAAQHWRLATAVSAALPTLAHDVVLPAANTEADPVIPYNEGLDVYDTESTASSMQSTVRSNVQPSTQSFGDSMTGSTPNAANVSTPSNADYDEFFDSAPIPMGHFESVDEQMQGAAVRSTGSKSKQEGKG
jgi:HemY protein